MNKQSCGSCYYGHNKNEGVVTCMRFPPSVTKADDKEVTSVFPLMRETGWCGEWRQGHKWDIRTGRKPT